MEKIMKYSTSILASWGAVSGLCLFVTAPLTSAAEKISETVDRPAVESISQEIVLPEVIIEDRVEQQQGEEIREYEFEGNADDVIILYWQKLAGDLLHSTLIALTDPDAQPLEGIRYFDTAGTGLNFGESEGDRAAFLLPTTGKYRLRFTVKTLLLRPNSENLSEASVHLLRVRKAANYERAITVANNLFNTDRYEEAISVYSQAIDYAPNSPIPYIWQTYAYGWMLMRSPTYADKSQAIRQAALAANDLSVDSEEMLEAIYKIFQLLGPEDQATVINNVRQFNRASAAAVNRGELPLEASTPKL